MASAAKFFCTSPSGCTNSLDAGLSFTGPPAWAPPTEKIVTGLIDIEGGWRFSHEDLAQNQGGLAGGTMIDEVSLRNHGTAVMGEIGGA